MAQLLSEVEINERIAQLPEWALQGKTIQTSRKFGNFVEAMAFVNRLVDPVEAIGHHPDISISYNRVTLNLTTHDLGGLTDADFKTAKIISQIH
jgi:4a-hydroxytetrahydrobiopterin dehydratase